MLADLGLIAFTFTMCVLYGMLAGLPLTLAIPIAALSVFVCSLLMRTR